MLGFVLDFYAPSENLPKAFNKSPEPFTTVSVFQIYSECWVNIFSGDEIINQTLCEVLIISTSKTLNHKISNFVLLFLF